jgi:hypothetical protein
MLTSREIRMLLEALRTKEITLKVEQGKISSEVRKLSGYSEDPEVGALQAKLSIMLEVASKRGD